MMVAISGRDRIVYGGQEGSSDEEMAIILIWTQNTNKRRNG
jgi:hypothetical protein